jgi:hypothetical protein
MPDWIFTWLIAAAATALLWPSTRWIHKHLQGLGLLTTNNPQGAVMVYYVALLPGVILREGCQWLVAKALRVKVKKFRLWPEKQKRGEIRLGLVEIDDMTDTVRATAVGIIPTLLGLMVIAAISGIFKTEALAAAVTTGDTPTILSGVGVFLSTTDFWLWVYLIFAIANAMLPEEHDRINWWILLGAMAAIVVALLVLDLGILLQAGLNGPLAQLANTMSLVLSLSLLIDLFFIVLISVAEWILSRALNREVEYK